MRILSVVACTALSLVVTPLFAAQQKSSTDFTISNPSNIPGATLPSGSYSIHVVNRLSDRYIVQVDSSDGAVHSTFLGIPNSKLPRSSNSGIVNWSNSVKGSDYLRGWKIAGAPSAVEFVYPKAEAVNIANANQAKVPAIDPASDSMAADPTLSPRDMKLVTLWLLSAERVGPSGSAPSIKAERYDEVAGNNQKPIIASLPHTASALPLLWLLCGCSMLAAAMLCFFRKRQVSGATAITPGRNR
ncbi:MAG: hypothetical protein ABI177_08780 [Edaphobacter sp.]